jgi:hypothetical protein
VSQVIADNEEVLFEEGVPSDPSAIHDLLLGAFAERRRALSAFHVDGTDFLNKEDLPSEFNIIEAKSITHAELTLRISIQFLNLLSNFKNQISAYQVNLLVTPWSEVFKRTDDFITKIQPFADLVDNIIPFAQSYEPEWADEIYKTAQSQAESLNTIVKCFENGDPAGLSDEIAEGFIPLFDRAVSLFEKSIIPDLKKRQVEDENSYSK